MLRIVGARLARAKSSPTLAGTMALQHTLIPPPPLDTSKSPIENALQLTPLTEFGPVGAFRLSWSARFNERLYSCEPF